MLNNFIYSKTKKLFELALNNNEVPEEAVAFIEDTKEIYNRNTYFSGDLSKYVKKDFFDETKVLTDAKILVMWDSVSQHTVSYLEFKELYDLDNIYYKLYHVTGIKTTSTQENTTVIENEYEFIIEITSYISKAFKVLHVIKKVGSNKYEVQEGLQVWYDVNNDTSKYSWADPNGTGVIYRMIDKNGNDCPYDFLSIKFKNGDDYYFTFTDSNLADASLSDYCNNNVIAPYYNNNHKQILNNIIIKGVLMDHNTFCSECHDIKLFSEYTQHNIFKGPTDTIETQNAISICHNEFLNCKNLTIGVLAELNYLNLSDSTVKTVSMSSLTGSELTCTGIIGSSTIKYINDVSVNNMENAKIRNFMLIQADLLYGIEADELSNCIFTGACYSNRFNSAYECEFGEDCSYNVFKGEIHNFKLGSNSSNNVFYPPLPKELPENTNNMCINGPKRYTFDGTNLTEDTN